jgi:Ser/Thr protein kinase RdoA (MazF antagonist)
MIKLMAFFPTQYSTLSAPALKDHLAAAYQLPLHTGRYLLRGVSDTYLLEGAAVKYILKVYRSAHRSRPEIEGEVALLLQLHAQGIPVAPPLPDQHGQFIQALEAAEGIRYGVLFAFAPGQPSYDLTAGQVQAVGREMARLHNLTSQITLAQPRQGYDIATTLTQPLQRLAPVFAQFEYPEGHAYLTETAAQFIDQLAALDTASFSHGYCHYDFLPKNFHFDAADRLTFFDFDFAGPGYLVNDVMVFGMHYFLHNITKRLSREEADRDFQLFVASYRQIRSLSDAELAAVPALGFAWWVFFLGFQADNFDDWSNSFFGPRYLRDRVGLIRQWVEWFTNIG